MPSALPPPGKRLEATAATEDVVALSVVALRVFPLTERFSPIEDKNACSRDAARRNKAGSAVVCGGIF